MTCCQSRTSTAYPVAVGLADAFHCGLPFVTEEGDESTEFAYLKDGQNGFVVSRGDVGELARSLFLLLDDDYLRTHFSSAARRDVATNGSIEQLSKGFVLAVQIATHP